MYVYRMWVNSVWLYKYLLIEKGVYDKIIKNLLFDI